MAAIQASDIKFHYSTTSGAAGNSTAKGANGSYLGKYCTTSLWAGGVANDLFDDITGAQNAASQVDYAGIWIGNANTANDYVTPFVWVSSETADGANLAIAIDNIAQSAANSASAQMAQIASSTTTPTGVGAFSTPTTFGTGLALGTLTKAAAGPVENGRGIWIRRSAQNNAAKSNDGGTISIQGDTGSL